MRTTALFHVIKGNIYWITDSYNNAVFPQNRPQLHLMDADSLPDELFDIDFDLVINLEEDAALAAMVGKLHYKNLTGIYLEDGVLKYTPSAAIWYDMSLISVFGKEQADILKKNNILSYQEILFSMLDFEFQGEPYSIFTPPKFPAEKIKIGVESTSGRHWPNKAWHGYGQLKDLLGKDGYQVIQFEKKEEISAYLSDIQSCDLIVSGDTLAMHIALAYQKPVVGIFNCTSPTEIYDYGLLEKIVSPLLFDNFYSGLISQEVISSIPIHKVYNSVMQKIRALETGRDLPA